jgi:DNA-binding transcriptional ArsR family regulator
LGYKELTEKDLSLEEKKVFGRIIDMWAAENPEDPYAHSTEANLINHAQKDDLSPETIRKVLDELEGNGLIRRDEEGGKIFIKYKVEAEHIVKELQKTAYVYEARDFKPPHH